MILEWKSKAILASVLLILLHWVSAKSTASCWTPFTDHNKPLPYEPMDHVHSYIQEFCTPKLSLAVRSDNSLTKKWAIGSTTLELRATVDRSDACQHVTFSINPRDKLCENALFQIADQCDIRHTQSKLGGSLLVDDCQVWSLGKFVPCLWISSLHLPCWRFTQLFIPLTYPVKSQPGTGNSAKSANLLWRVGLTCTICK